MIAGSEPIGKTYDTALIYINAGAILCSRASSSLGVENSDCRSVSTPAVQRPRTARVLARAWPLEHWEQMMSKLSADDRNDLEKSAFAFPDERKEPLENASHVRNAIARFNQVKGVSDDERDAAWKRIKAAATKFDVEISEESWREIGK